MVFRQDKRSLRVSARYYHQSSIAPAVSLSAERRAQLKAWESGSTWIELLFLWHLSKPDASSILLPNISLCLVSRNSSARLSETIILVLAAIFFA